MSRGNYSAKGFMLPTILILSIVLLTLALSLLQLGTATVRSLQDKNWNRLAKVSSQAGVSYVADCIKTNPFAWAATLSSSTNCTGAAASPVRPNDVVSSVLLDTSATSSKWSSTFTASKPVRGSDGIKKSKITGIVNLLSSSGSILKTYSRDYIAIVKDTGLAQVSGGYLHTCALATEQQVYCSGYNSEGQLGNGTNTSTTSPVPFGASLGKQFSQVSSGYVHTCALTTDQQVYCSGRNDYGQFGNGTNADTTTPVESMLLR